VNRIRRKELQKAVDLLEQAKSIIEACRDEEQDAYDNLPESLQYSDRGEAMDGFIYEMEDAIDSIDSAVDTITDNVINA
jgi:hypothetical protein